VQSRVVGLFEHDSVLRGLIKYCEFLEQLRNRQLHNDDSDQGSLLHILKYFPMPDNDVLLVESICSYYPCKL